MPTFPTSPTFPTMPGGAFIPGVPQTEEQMLNEQSYVENILRFNRGKMATFYLTYENNREWNAQVVRGVIQTAGRDHIIVSDPETGRRYLLLMVNLDYVVFDEPVTYIAPRVPSYVQMHLEESREG
ncbi:MAG: spore coat protein GerQ [Hydrogenibacillus sp.]|nr:spore coat protein GerQ [Hydrogenibacillus sp.]